MAELQTVNPVADSSPAVAVPTNSADYATWRQTGKLPEQPKEAPAPSKEASEEGSQASETAPESEPGKKQEHKPSKAESRLNELLSDLKKAGLSPAELKTFKREMQQEAKDQPKAEPEKTVKPEGLEAPKKPKIEDFKTYEEFEAAKDKYYEDLSEYKSHKAIEDYRTQQAQEASAREAKAKLAEAKTRYGDEAEATIVESAKGIFSADVPATVKAIINDSPVLVDLLYVLNGKGGELAEFVALARTNPGAAIRKAVLMERLVSEELAKGKTESTRDESGKFVSKEKEAPEQKVSKAPPPPKEVSGRGSAPPDEVESAAKSNDFRAFRDAANRRDLAKRQGR